MSNIWFTADHHFGHENIIKYTNRPFSSVEEMDEVMIQRWNEVIKQDDTVYQIGDFTLGVNFYKYYHRLNGLKFFLPGSHDHRWLKEYSPIRDGINHILDPLFSLELPNPNLVENDKYPLVIVLCHYSMRVWDRSHYGSFHLYGHSHGNLPGLGRSMDVGVDTNNFYPYSLEEVVERLSKIEPHNGVKNERP